MPTPKRGYRRRFSRPQKGRRRWKSGALKEVNRKGDLLGFDVNPETEGQYSGEVGPTGRELRKNCIRVLSLFDGIATGLAVLEKLGFQVESYYSSEVDEKALRVQRFRFHKQIVCLGSVCGIQEEQLDALGRIDLLIGGSPCQDLSLVNPRRKGLHGEGSSGKLFFEYHRILQYLQHKALLSGCHLFWLFENTFSMDTSTKKEMSEYLGCEPVKICSRLCVPMRRTRNFWGNIPLMEKIPSRPRCSDTLQAFLKPYRCAAVSVLHTVTTQSHSQLSGYARKHPVVEEGTDSLLFVSELELLFGFPEHYTDAGNLSVTDRRKLLGNAWCAHVIMIILKPLSILFSLKDK